MRRNRRNSHSGVEFGGSGEDSFVAVVVTKLTGALLFILLLTMVIMALLPKAVDSIPSSPERASESAELTVATPDALPEAIAGRPYTLALAARGGQGPLAWSIAGELPPGIELDPDSGVLKGTPRAGTTKPAELIVRVSDGATSAAAPTRLVVYQSDVPLSTPAWWKPGLPPVPWRAWLEQGFGFLVLGLVHMVGMSAVASLQRWSASALEQEPADDDSRRAAGRRFAVYRATVRLSSATAATVLAVWLWRHHA
jgi:hypothetical protein